MRFAVAPKLEQGLAEPVPRVDVVGLRLEDRFIKRSCLFPLALERQLDRLLGALTRETCVLFTFFR
jgi:hypothetical protein